MTDKQDRATLLRSVGPLMNLGVTFAVAIGGLAYLGHWLDERWSSEPWLTLLGAILGMTIGFINLFRVVVQSMKQGQKSEGLDKHGGSGGPSGSVKRGSVK